MLEPVERASDRRRGSELRVDDDDVLRGRRLTGELGEDATEPVARIRPAYVGQDVAWASERVVTLLETELAEVARHRRLRHATPGLRECVSQLELRADALARHDAPDQALSLELPERELLVRPSRAALHAAAFLVGRVWRRQQAANTIDPVNDPQQPYELEITLPPELEGGVYSNVLHVHHTAYEFTLDFGVMRPAERDEGDSPVRVPVRVVSRVRIPVTLLFDVLKALNQNLANYEGAFGPISEPEPQNPQSEQ